VAFSAWEPSSVRFDDIVSEIYVFFKRKVPVCQFGVHEKMECDFTIFLTNRYPDQLDLYVCFLVLWMQKTFHCLAEVFGQLALRRMTASFDQI